MQLEVPKTTTGNAVLEESNKLNECCSYNVKGSELACYAIGDYDCSSCEDLCQ